MSENKTNRQTIRSRRMLQSALLDLLKEKPYAKVTVSNIVEHADLARSTFYAHFDTKEDLLESILDKILNQFFEYLYERDVLNPSHQEDLEINIKFFGIWRENAETIKLLNAIDIDCLLIKKFRKYWEDHDAKHFSPKFPHRNPALTRYENEYLTYSFVGILRHWLSEGMKQSPEVMGGLLYQLTGPPILEAIQEKYQDLII